MLCMAKAEVMEAANSIAAAAINTEVCWPALYTEAGSAASIGQHCDL